MEDSTTPALRYSNTPFRALVGDGISHLSSTKRPPAACRKGSAGASLWEKECWSNGVMYFPALRDSIAPALHLRARPFGFERAVLTDPVLAELEVLPAERKVGLRLHGL